MIASPLTPNLKLLRLSGILETLEVRNQQAIREQWSFEEFLTRLLQDEVERRAQKIALEQDRPDALDPCASRRIHYRKQGVHTSCQLRRVTVLFCPTG